MRKPNTIKMRSLDEIINLVKNKILHLTDPTIFFFELEGEFNLNSRDYKDVLTYLTELKYLQETKKKELATEKENKKIEHKKKLKKFFLSNGRCIPCRFYLCNGNANWSYFV